MQKRGNKTSSFLRVFDGVLFKKIKFCRHKTIHAEKLDFYCVNHQTENFIGNCQQCLMNICSRRYKEGPHPPISSGGIVRCDKNG